MFTSRNAEVWQQRRNALDTPGSLHHAHETNTENPPTALTQEAGRCQSFSCALFPERELTTGRDTRYNKTITDTMAMSCRNY